MAELSHHDRYRLPIWRRLTGGLRVLPDFIILGAQKAGTTTIYDNLVKHPAVHPCDIKEVHYFDSNWGKGQFWYRGHFDYIRHAEAVRAAGQPWQTGEGSPYYLFHPHVPRRVKELCPAARLIVVLRNPVERAYSHYQHEKRKGREPLSFAEALAAEDERLREETVRLEGDETYSSFAHQHHSYKARGRYAEQLERWFHVFPREQFLILESSELNNDFSGTYGRLLEFLHLPPHEIEAPRRSNVGSYEQMDPAVRDELVQYFGPWNERLEQLLGRQFSWR